MVACEAGDLGRCAKVRAQMAMCGCVDVPVVGGTWLAWSSSAASFFEKGHCSCARNMSCLTVSPNV